jgi:hypothetical protein
MRPLVGISLGGTALTDRDDLAIGSGTIGQPVWGPGQLLRDLELRCGIPGPVESHALRVQRWSARMAELAPKGRFYSRSYEIDAIGTAAELLSWRDELIEAGWDGRPLDGPPRLAALSEIEHSAGAAPPPGIGDRLERVRAEVELAPAVIYDELALADARELWPGAWRRLFDALEAQGTWFSRADVRSQLANGDTDLRRLQRLVAGQVSRAEPFRGDGSVVVLRADTSIELADAVAAFVAACGESSVVVIREDDAPPLDAACRRHGLGSQGVGSVSRWRPLLQVLPLALEIAFAPRDPRAFLALLTLPHGPFAGFVGRELAGAFCEAPGTGGAAWRDAKDTIANKIAEWRTRDALAEGAEAGPAEAAGKEAAAEKIAQIMEWLEAPAHSGEAPKAALVAITERVGEWLRVRLATVEQPQTLSAAYGQARSMLDALTTDPRAVLDRVAVRQIADDVAASGATTWLAEEQAGRVDHVDSASALCVPRDVVVWWSFARTAVVRPSRWRDDEQTALRKAGIELVDPAARLAAIASGWKNAVFSARERLVLATPGVIAGAAAQPHALWDEIVGRLGGEEEAAPLIVSAQDWLLGPVLKNVRRATGLKPRVERLEPLALPPARTTWRIRSDLVTLRQKHSASSVTTMIGCPLRFALEDFAKLRGGDALALPSRVLENGVLGHRLVEELHHRGAIGCAAEEVREAAGAVFDELAASEHTTLLADGMSFERSQLRAQLVDAAVTLSELLARHRLKIVAAEEEIEAPWSGRVMSGRLDLLLAAEDGERLVLDLKWGHRTYRDLLHQGSALQLAVYASVLKTHDKRRGWPSAAYFSLSRGRLLAPSDAVAFGADRLDVPPLAETWKKTERTLERVEERVAGGRLDVTGVAAAPPLLQILKADDDQHFAYENGAACQYCACGAICGKSWEVP